MGLCLDDNIIFCSNVFLRLTSLGWDLLSFSFLFLFFFYFFVLYIYIYIYIYIYNLKHNASLTHVTSFRLMTPRPVGFRALGVETPLRA